MPSDGETPWDERLCDAFVEIAPLGWPSHDRHRPGPRPPRRAPTSSSPTSPSPPWSTRRGEESALAGELERDGLISTETVQPHRL